jgi:hypothetical protein
VTTKKTTTNPIPSQLNTRTRTHTHTHMHTQAPHHPHHHHLSRPSPPTGERLTDPHTTVSHFFIFSFFHSLIFSSPPFIVTYLPMYSFTYVPISLSPPTPLFRSLPRYYLIIIIVYPYTITLPYHVTYHILHLDHTPHAYPHTLPHQPLPLT